jgi:hypothetical protein
MHAFRQQMYSCPLFLVAAGGSACSEFLFVRLAEAVEKTSPPTLAGGLAVQIFLRVAFKCLPARAGTKPETVPIINTHQLCLSRNYVHTAHRISFRTLYFFVGFCGCIHGSASFVFLSIRKQKTYHIVALHLTCSFHSYAGFFQGCACFSTRAPSMEVDTEYPETGYSFFCLFAASIPSLLFESLNCASPMVISVCAATGWTRADPKMSPAQSPAGRSSQPHESYTARDI